MREVATFCLSELERLEDRLQELASSGGHCWLASAGDDEHDDSGVFFVLSCSPTLVSMRLLDVAIAKMHVGWVFGGEGMGGGGRERTRGQEDTSVGNSRNTPNHQPSPPTDRGAIFDVVYHGSNFYITLAEQDGDHMLLDTRFPDFTAREASVELTSYEKGGKFHSLTAHHSRGKILKAGAKFSAAGSYADAVKDRKPRFLSAGEAKRGDEVEEKVEGKVEEGLRLGEDDEEQEEEEEERGREEQGDNRAKHGDNDLTIPENNDDEREEEAEIPAGDDVEVLKGGYHQVYVVLKDPGGSEDPKGAAAAGAGMTTRHRVLVRCGRWCYEGVVDLGFISGELNLKHLPAVIPFLHSQQDKLVYAYDYTKLPKFSPFRQPLRRLYDATKTIEAAAQEAAPTLQSAV